jgi:putative oxidoreductase
MHAMFRPRLTGPAAVVPFVVRLAAGVTMIAVSLSKFTRHESLVESFERYDIPAAELAVYLAGTIELVGGVLFVIGFLVRPVGVVVAAHFLVAVLTGGRVDTDLFHVGLGSLLLAAGLFLAWSGAGRWSVDERLDRQLPTRA